MKQPILNTIILVGVLLVPQTVSAYLDAGTGSQILQIALATAIGAVFALKTGWHKIKAVFRNVFRNDPKRK